MEISEKTAMIAMAINLVLFGLKYVSARVSGSIALKAEAYHTLADFIASLTIFAGLKLAKRKTKTFPYGLYKIENLLSVFISLVILFTGYEIVLSVIKADDTPITNSWLAIACLVISLVATFIFSRYEKSIGKKTGSPVLLADSTHIGLDVLSNVVVLVAVVLSLFGLQIDKIAALIVVGFIAKSGLQILWNGVRVLLDASLDHDTLSKIEKIILHTPQVTKMKSLTGRNSGRFKFVEANIVIKTHHLDRAKFITDSIEKTIKENVKNIDQILIHYEPLLKKEICYTFPLADDQATLSPHFGEAPYFMLATFSTGNPVAAETHIIRNPFTESEKSKGILAAEFLVKNPVDFVFVKKDFGKKGPSYVFSDANVEVIVTDAETPGAALEKLGLSLKVS